MADTPASKVPFGTSGSQPPRYPRAVIHPYYRPAESVSDVLPFDDMIAAALLIRGLGRSDITSTLTLAATLGFGWEGAQDAMNVQCHAAPKNSTHTSKGKVGANNERDVDVGKHLAAGKLGDARLMFTPKSDAGSTLRSIPATLFGVFRDQHSPSVTYTHHHIDQDHCKVLRSALQRQQRQLYRLTLFALEAGGRGPQSALVPSAAPGQDSDVRRVPSAVCPLASIALCYCGNVGDKGVEFIAGGLRRPLFYDQPSATSLPGSADNDVAGLRPSAAECLRRTLVPFPVLTTIVKLQLTAVNLGNDGCIALAESLASWGCTTKWRPAEQSLPPLPLRDVVLSENDISDVCDFALSFFAMGDAAAFYDVLPHRGGVAQAMMPRAKPEGWQPSRAPVLRLREFSVSGNALSRGAIERLQTAWCAADRSGTSGLFVSLQKRIYGRQST